MSIAAKVLAPVLVATVGTAVLAAAQPLAKFRATAVNLEAPAGAATTQVQVQIWRWSTDAERAQLTTSLNEKGPAGLLRSLAAMKPVGTIRTPGTVGYNLRYARESKLGTSDRVVLVAERPMSFPELRQGGKSTEYPFTVIELRVGPDGKGEGRMSTAAKVIVDKPSGLMALEDYSSSPVMLNNLTRE